ncbi:MAG TPA: hypothetical protein VGW76_19085 [Pyrinomonadaceae bacterium]|nr:hypothetical protein [Pyrinomonadaceae bacterium]
MIKQNPFAAVVNSATKRKVSPYFRALFFAALLVTFQSQIFNAESLGQTQSPSAAKRAPKKKHRLRITKGYVTGVSLKADKASMTEVAADLAKLLDAPVTLAPSIQKQVITVEFADIPLEPAMRLLAPRVFMDYEIRADAQPKLLGIFLVGQDDPDPAKDAIVQGSSQAMLFEGNTEETAEETVADEPLQVDLDDANLTIKSKKQPLVALVITIADVLGVPAEIKYESNEIVDTVIKNTPFEDAIPRLSPNIRLYVRADVTRSERTALRLVLVPPVANAGQ